MFPLMTEKEYIQDMKDCAVAYKNILLARKIVNQTDKKIIKKWENVKAYLSPSSMIELCDLWLLKNEEKK